MLKVCIKCGNELPGTTEYFAPRKESSDGLRAECRACKRTYIREWRSANKERLDLKYGEWRKEYQKNYNEVNRAKLAEHKRQYYEARKGYFRRLGRKWYEENRDDSNGRRRDNYIKNRDAELANKRAYYLANEASIGSYNRQYRIKNPGRMAIIDQRRRARERGLPRTFTLEQWNECKSFFHNTCAYCGDESPLEQEHFVPVASGGGYTSSNILPACRKCNCDKRDKDFFEWFPVSERFEKSRLPRIIEYFAGIKKKEVDKK